MVDEVVQGGFDIPAVYTASSVVGGANTQARRRAASPRSTRSSARSTGASIQPDPRRAKLRSDDLRLGLDGRVVEVFGTAVRPLDWVDLGPVVREARTLTDNDPAGSVAASSR
jgi:hypothetical protein